MSFSAYTEDQLVEQPAIGLFVELGWQTLSAAEETLGAGGTLGRLAKSEAVLPKRLEAALQRVNPMLPPEAITGALEELTRNRSAMSMAAANREMHELLKQGVKVSVPDKEHGGQKTELVRVIDWQNPVANDFLLVSQMSIQGPLYLRRPDLIGFVNGLPLVVVELKKPGVPAQQAFTDNLTCYKADIPQLFWGNALMIASNGTDSRVGSLTADWERFFEWKRIASENEPRRVSLEVMICGTCDKKRLLDLVENFILFSEHKAGLVKIVGQNHQFLGVNNAIAASLKARTEGHGRGGVFWQTQGSGKSFSMVFYSQKILRTVPGDWTFVIVTDRVELDEQIATTFKACGAVSESEGEVCHANSGGHLRELLRGNHRYVFTLVHKFQTDELLTDRRDVIVLTDEAHRSQYDTLAMNMRAALPNAIFVAFTGTPLIAGEERTREVFGDYVSIYDFQQSVQDGATVPLFYENRTPELHLDNPNLNEDIYALIEEAELSPEAEEKLQRELGNQYHLITRDDRLETVAKDIMNHFLGRGFQGKAMVVSIDKVTALKMHAKVQKHWVAEQTRVWKELEAASKMKPLKPGQSKRDFKDDYDAEKVRELQRRLDLLEHTDMAVIVSAEQNEVAKMAAKGIDIVPHRKRMNEEKLDELFKDPKEELRLVFVCAMWLTGFDAPSCSTIYLDKPMRNHTLMQTIARANRVYPGKQSGLIVDYANVFASLERALAIYGAGKDGKTPVRDKQELVEQLRAAMQEAMEFCQRQAVNLTAIHEASGMEKLHLLGEAVNALISPDELRKQFLAHEKLVRALYQAVKPDKAAIEFAPMCSLLATLADSIKLQTGEGETPDITPIMGRLNDLLDDSIGAEGFTIAEGQAGARHGVIDLSKINFEALAKKFKESKQKNLDIEKLKAAIRATLDKIVHMHRALRTDYQQKFEELIASYNAGSLNIDQLFAALLEQSRKLTDEQTRHVRENLLPAELVIFDILTRPAPELSDAERDEVKKVAKQLLSKVQSLLGTMWKGTQQGRSKLQDVIKDTLDEGLPRAYDKPLYEAKVEAVFEHFYETAA
ncbi:type I restriction endonuclease subunit R [Prosthecobacter vanneervenii]|uniref:Type I restriction enzyme endonuclease subunit n=1 Tax=Prosthecobacter vanneervenii TaxID=48466 RepID=A0A7W8DKK3_9BACT|nr:type I restriction endonuclease subunit R [Prosthecobacter vanneervenii]MBB5033125.1 type I restriction enzyme R subunit [Prosthecobacter vanneervenii]